MLASGTRTEAAMVAASATSSGVAWRDGRVLTLGRDGLLGGNASDVAKETLIRGARRSLKICQQDLFFAGFTKVEDHKVCQWIAEALLATPALEVSIVVSPKNAAASGVQYSWGHGASGTFAGLKNIITAKVRQRSSDLAAADGVLKRLHVAPFCFTGARLTLTPGGNRN